MMFRERTEDIRYELGVGLDFILNRKLEVVWYWNIVRETEKIILDISKHQPFR